MGQKEWAEWRMQIPQPRAVLSCKLNSVFPLGHIFYCCSEETYGTLNTLKGGLQIFQTLSNFRLTRSTLERHLPTSCLLRTCFRYYLLPTWSFFSNEEIHAPSAMVSLCILSFTQQVFIRPCLKFIQTWTIRSYPNRMPFLWSLLVCAPITSGGHSRRSTCSFP